MILRRLSESKRYNCSTEQLQFLTDQIIAFIRLHGADNILLSHELSFNFTMATMTKIVEARCGCGRTFASDLGARLHQIKSRGICTSNEVHIQERYVKLFTCNYCDMESYIETEVNTHRRKYHFSKMKHDALSPSNPLIVFNLKTKLYHCVLCEKSFKTRCVKHVLKFHFIYLSNNFNVPASQEEFASCANFQLKQLDRAAKKRRFRNLGPNLRVYKRKRQTKKPIRNIATTTRGNHISGRSRFAKELFDNFHLLAPDRSYQVFHDFVSKYGEFTDDGYFCTYAIFDLSKLPDGLNNVNAEEGERALLYLGSGLFGRPLSAFSECFSRSCQGWTKVKKLKPIIQDNGRFLICKVAISRIREALFACEGSLLQFLGITKRGNGLINSTLITPRHYPENWKWKQVESFGALLYRRLLNSIKFGRILEGSALKIACKLSQDELSGKSTLDITKPSRNHDPDYMTRGKSNYKRSKHSSDILERLNSNEQIGGGDEIEDFVAIYGDCSIDGLFVGYAIFDRSKLPEDLSAVTAKCAAKALIYLGSGVFDRPLGTIVDALHKNIYEDKRKADGFKAVIADGHSFVICRYISYDDRKAAFACEASLIQFVGLDKKGPLLNSCVITPEYYPRRWKWQNVETFGGFLFQCIVGAIQYGLVIGAEDIETLLRNMRT